MEDFNLWLLDNTNNDFAQKYFLYALNDDYAQSRSRSRHSRFNKALPDVFCQGSFDIEEDISEGILEKDHSWCFEVVPKIEKSFRRKYSSSLEFAKHDRDLYSDKHVCHEKQIGILLEDSREKYYFTIDMKNFHFRAYENIAEILFEDSSFKRSIVIIDDNYKIIETVWISTQVVCNSGVYYYCDRVQKKCEEGYCYSCDVDKELDIHRDTYSCIADIVNKYPQESHTYIMSSSHVSQKALEMALRKVKTETFKRSHGITIEGIANVLTQLKKSGAISFGTYEKSLFEVDDFEQENDRRYIADVTYKAIDNGEETFDVSTYVRSNKSLYNEKTTTARKFSIKNIEKFCVPDDHLSKTMFEIILFIGNYKRLNVSQADNLVKFIHDIKINTEQFATLSTKLRKFINTIKIIPQFINDESIMESMTVNFQIVLGQSESISFSRNLQRDLDSIELPEQFMLNDLSDDLEKKNLKRDLSDFRDLIPATCAVMEMLGIKNDKITKRHDSEDKSNEDKSNEDEYNEDEEPDRNGRRGDRGIDKRSRCRHFISPAKSTRTGSTRESRNRGALRLGDRRSTRSDSK